MSNKTESLAGRGQPAWCLAYWMPYDNNLAGFAEPILGMLADGVSSNRVAVAVQIDKPGPGPMSRMLMRGDAHEHSEADSNVGSSAAALEDFLTWASERVDAANWAVVFLGHGGRLDEFSPDRGATSWMRTDQAAAVVADFNREHNVELLFLQNCCKGTLETIYNFRNCASVTLASQTEIGAPNYYYTETLRYLAAEPTTNGRELASKIIECERPDMFSSLCVVSNSHCRALPSAINPIVDTLLTMGLAGLDMRHFEGTCDRGDMLVDVLSFLEALVPRDSGIVQDFGDFYCQQLIVEHAISGSGPGAKGRLSGLSLRVPTRLEDIDAYRHLDFFTHTNISDLFRQVLRSGATQPLPEK